MFNYAKDAMTSRAAQAFVNSRISRYGRVDRLKIDSQNRQIEVVCSLDGEVEPITVRVDRYAIHEENGKRFFEPQSLSCSRRWLERALEDYAVGRRVELPGWASAAL